MVYADNDVLDKLHCDVYADNDVLYVPTYVTIIVLYNLKLHCDVVYANNDVVDK